MPIGESDKWILRLFILVYGGMSILVFEFLFGSQNMVRICLVEMGFV